MANIKQLDPGASPLHFFGAELRRLREQAGLTLVQLGKIVFCTGSLIGQIETAAKPPTLEFTQRVDAALEADGMLLRLWPLVERSKLPYSHRRVAEIEALATQIEAFHPYMVHGLLQTEDYARAVLSEPHAEDLEVRLGPWMARQEILKGADAPLYWVVLGEAALYQEIGGREVMAGQLAHLLGFQSARRVQIQVLPYAAGAHAGLAGAFSLFSFEERPGLVYSETYPAGELSVDPPVFRDSSLRYDLLQAAALPIRDSADLIAHVLEEHYGQRPETGQHSVA